MFADTHCHLCPGLDDGPTTMEEAIQMCQIAWNEGIRMIASTAHQNAYWPDVTPEAICNATREVTEQLAEIGCDLQLVPTAEVVVDVELIQRWKDGELLSIGQHQRYLLIEMPHGVFLDLRDYVAEMVAEGLHPVLAHVERYPQIVFGKDHICDLIEAGCVIQISASAINDTDRRLTKVLRQWAQRGLIHVIGTDAHSPRSRAPRMLSAFDQYCRWTSVAEAERVFVDNGFALLRGQTFRVPTPVRRRRQWLFSNG